MFEVPCWYSLDEIRNTLIVWEGVLAIWNFESNNRIKCVELWKEYEDGYISFMVKHDVKEITSEGYWTCAEITGIFKNGKSFFYHAVNPDKSKLFLNFINKYLDTHIKTIELSLDPNPLRNWTKKECEKRIKSWRDLCYSLSKTSAKINFNYNMPI
uniref:DUF4265 domain-containing protein n=1 Tax=Parastrongyloides trichosuri TaxID=131310 RepID=A0A0N4Z343_PARTI